MLLVSLGAFVFVLFYNLFFFQVQPGLGFGVFILLLNLFFFLVRNSGSRNLKFGIISSIIATVFAFLFGFRANEIVQAINILVAIFFSITALYFYKQVAPFDFKIFNFLANPILLAFSSIKSLLNFQNLDSFKQTNLSPELTKSLMRGFAIAIPIFILLLLILTNADPIFGKLTQNFAFKLGERTLISIIIFAILFVLGITKVIEKYLIENSYEEKIPSYRFIEIAVVLSSITLLFAAFIIVQVQYLFANLDVRQLHEIGIQSLTYSEYVRKGFFELLMASTISLTIIAFITYFLKGLKANQKMITQILASALIIETALILFSDFQRLSLYAMEHGLTRARVFGFIFLVWLAILLAIFLIQVFTRLKRKWFFTLTSFSTLLVFVLINLFNIDGEIAAKYRPTVNKEIDYYYLASLSTDARDSWIPAIDDAKRILTEIETEPADISADDNRQLFYTKNTLERIKNKKEYLEDKYSSTENLITKYQAISARFPHFEYDQNGVPEKNYKVRGWQSINLSEQQAYQLFLENKQKFDEVNLLLAKIDALQQKNQLPQQPIQLDRSTNAPLTN